MEGELMAAVTIKLRTRVAWWVQPSLAAAFVLAMLVDRWIDAIVDRGIKIETGAA